MKNKNKKYVTNIVEKSLEFPFWGTILGYFPMSVV